MIIQDLFNQDNKTLFLRARIRFGDQAQVDMAIEEMAELTQALLHYRRGRITKTKVQEELGDVFIVLEQMRLLFTPDGVNLAIHRKLERLRERLMPSGSAR